AAEIPKKQKNPVQSGLPTDSRSLSHQVGGTPHTCRSGAGSVSVGRPWRGTASLCYLLVSALSRGCLARLYSSGVATLAAAIVPRTRRTFARLNKPLDVPNLIDIQRRSFEWLTDAEKGGLRETIDDISPIEDYTGNLAVQFGEFVFDEPVAPIEECREKD